MPDTGEKTGRYVLKSADRGGIRGRQEERLEQLFEERCDAPRRARQDGGLAADGYAGMLAVLKARAVYVPLDAGFDLGLLVETAGPTDKVVKLLPPLTVSQEELNHGLELLAESVRKVAPLHEMSRAAAG